MEPAGLRALNVVHCNAVRHGPAEGQASVLVSHCLFVCGTNGGHAGVLGPRALRLGRVSS
jgi:hypothetical protein